MFRSRFFAGIILSTMLLSLAGHAQSGTAAASQESPVSEQQLSKLRSGIIVRAAGDPPFHVKAMFTAKSKDGGSNAGTYEETWIDPSHWRREVILGEQTWVELKLDDKFYATKMNGAATRPNDVAGILLSRIKATPDQFMVSDLTINGRAITRLSIGANSAWFFDTSSGAILARKFGPQLTNYAQPDVFRPRGAGQRGHEQLCYRNRDGYLGSGMGNGYIGKVRHHGPGWGRVGS